MSEYQPSPGFEQLSPTNSRTGLWVALIGVATCLILVIILVSLAGMGWLASAGIQDGNATATTQAQNDSTTATSQAQNDNATATAQIQNYDPTATAQARFVPKPPGWFWIIGDKFVSNDRGWRSGFHQGDYGSATLLFGSGVYRWQVEANSEEGILWWEYPDWHSHPGLFYASVDCRLTSGKASGTGCGLIFHLLDDDNFYEFIIGEDQLMNVALNKEDEWFYLLPWEHTELIIPGESNRLTVLAERTHYSFFINGVLAYELDDDSLRGGKIGLVVDVWGENKAEFEFDNFWIYEP